MPGSFGGGGRSLRPQGSSSGSGSGGGSGGSSGGRPGGPSLSERDRQYCELCGKMENLLRCSRCRSSFYCSKEHQRQDWKKHKLVCQVGEKVSAPGTGQPLSRAA
ncbi:unnamed protein product, partial [Rangifer tarandus platyrhynchus]